MNPPNGAFIDFYLKTAPDGPMTLEVVDANGTVVRTWTGDRNDCAGCCSWARRRARRWRRHSERLAVLAGWHA